MPSEVLDYVLRTEQEKQAAFGEVVNGVGKTFENFVGKAPVVTVLTGGIILKSIYDKLQNDSRRKSLLESVTSSDPVLKDTDKAKLLEWYATIYHYAPTVSLDRNSVRELLLQFARFGKVDMQTLKLLAETEKSLADADRSRSIWNKII